MKAVIVVGGPNGAGKTTAASTLLPRSLGIIEFVNADEIARGLSPFNPEGSALAAGRLMLERMQMLAQAGASFAFETTLSGRSHARFLRTCRAAGRAEPCVSLAAIGAGRARPGGPTRP